MKAQFLFSSLNINFRIFFYWLFYLFLSGMLLFILGCASTPKNDSSSGKQSSTRQVGPVNNPLYFGKGGETQDIVVEGRAQIVESGEQVAFDSAIQHAMREAVERVLGTMIDARTKVDNAELISDKIYSRSYGFVQRYEVLSEDKKQNTLFVRIRAWVVLGDVRSDALALGIIQDRANRPVILVMIDEKNFDGDRTDFAQRKIEEVLLSKQFEFVDNQQLEKILAKQRKTVNQLLKNQDELFSTALDSGAQVVIGGKVEKQINDVSKNKLFQSKNLKSVTVSLNLNSFTAGDARLLAAVTRTKAGVGLSENAALQKATVDLANEVAGKLLDDFIKKWDERINSGFEYSVILTGITFDDVIAIKNRMQRNIEGIKAVFDRGYTGQTQTLLVRYTGESSRLAQALVSPGKLPVKMALENYDSKTIILYKDK